MSDDRNRTIRLTIDMTYNAEQMHYDDPEGIRWFNEDVLGGALQMWSDEIGDWIGSVQIVEPELMSSSLSEMIANHPDVISGNAVALAFDRADVLAFEVTPGLPYIDPNDDDGIKAVLKRLVYGGDDEAGPTRGRLLHMSVANHMGYKAMYERVLDAPEAAELKARLADPRMPTFPEDRQRMVVFSRQTNTVSISWSGGEDHEAYIDLNLKTGLSSWEETQWVFHEEPEDEPYDYEPDVGAIQNIITVREGLDLSDDADWGWILEQIIELHKKEEMLNVGSD